MRHLTAVPDGSPDPQGRRSPRRAPVVSAELVNGWTAQDARSAPGSGSAALDLWLPGGRIVRLRTTPLPGGPPGAVHLVLDAVGDRDELIELIVSPMLTRRPPRV